MHDSPWPRAAACRSEMAGARRQSQQSEERRIIPVYICVDRRCLCLPAPGRASSPFRNGARMTYFTCLFHCINATSRGRQTRTERAWLAGVPAGGKPGRGKSAPRGESHARSLSDPRGNVSIARLMAMRRAFVSVRDYSA